MFLHEKCKIGFRTLAYPRKGLFLVAEQKCSIYVTWSKVDYQDLKVKLMYMVWYGTQFPQLLHVLMKQ